MYSLKIHVDSTAKNRPCRIFNCLVVNNEAGRDQPEGDGINIEGVVSAVIESCTIVGNDDIGIKGTSSTIVSNCILRSHATEDLDISAGNLFYTCTEDTEDSGPGVIYTDPKFVQGYRLSHDELEGGGDSPCIDAGSTLAETAGLQEWSTRTDGHWDFEQLDLGYHYPTDWFPPPQGTVIVIW
jgi:hypothetical protein